MIYTSFSTRSIERIIYFYPNNTLMQTETYLEFYCIPISDPIKNEITSCFVFAVNITDKIQFNESRERLNSIVSLSSDAIFVVDLNQIIVNWNTAAESMFTYKDSEILGQSIMILDHLIDPETLSSMFSTVAQSNNFSIRNIESVEVKTKNATLIVDFTIYPFVDETGSMIGILAIVRDRTEVIIANKLLELSEMQMRELALRIDTERENERKKIAFAIHDELGYALTAIKMNMNWFKKNIKITDPIVNERTDDMLNLVDVVIKKVKTLSADLRPPILDHFGLVAAIEEQAENFQRRTGIRCKVNISENASDIEVEEQYKTPIFRIFQEAQTNITRYAKASRVDVNIDYVDGLFKMEVIDNGVGIPKEKINAINSFGLLGIREKAKAVNGQV